MKARTGALRWTFAALAWLNAAELRSEEALRAEIRDGHASTTALMRTCSCNVTIRWASGKAEKAEWWWKPDATKVIRRSGIQTDEILIANGTIKGLHTHAPVGQAPQVTGYIRAGEVYEPCDVLTFALLRLPGADGRPVRVDHLLAGGADVRSVRWKTEQGRKIASAELKHALMSMELLFDPATNFLLTKVRFTSRAKESQGQEAEARVASFREVLPGFFFPEKTELFRGGSLWQTIEFANVRVNATIPAAVFTLTFPHDTVVSDQITRSVYRVASDGRPIGPVTTKDGTVVRPLEPTDTAGIAYDSPFRGPSRDEPVSWYYLLAPVSALLLILVALVGVYQRIRQARS